MPVVKARLLPRSFQDVVTSTLVAIVQITVLFALPAWLTATLSGSKGMGIAVAVLFYIVFGLFSVRELRISDSGIELVRIMGNPKHLEWAEVERIELVSSRELIVKGWLWPLFPAREMTPSFTSYGHYRISFRREFVYFPPDDKELFERLIPPEIVARIKKPI